MSEQIKRLQLKQYYCPITKSTSVNLESNTHSLNRLEDIQHGAVGGVRWLLLPVVSFPRAVFFAPAVSRPQIEVLRLTTLFTHSLSLSLHSLDCLSVAERRYWRQKGVVSYSNDAATKIW